jgi:hypothetical protein
VPKSIVEVLQGTSLKMCVVLTLWKLSKLLIFEVVVVVCVVVVVVVVENENEWAVLLLLLPW